jgi:hypothetical protein
VPVLLKSQLLKIREKSELQHVLKSQSVKNHINGGGYEDGRILVTPQGFMHG